MTTDENIENIKKKIEFLLSKHGIFEPNCNDYSERDMRHYYADKRKYKEKFDLYHAEIASGKIEI